MSEAIDIYKKTECYTWNIKNQIFCVSIIWLVVELSLQINMLVRTIWHLCTIDLLHLLIFYKTYLRILLRTFILCIKLYMYRCMIVRWIYSKKTSCTFWLKYKQAINFIGQRIIALYCLLYSFVHIMIVFWILLWEKNYNICCV